MGGHTNSLFSRLVQISDFSKGVLLNDERLQLLKSELKESKLETKDKSSNLVKFHYDDDFQIPGFQLFTNILIGGTEKDNAKNTYLERFSLLDFNNSKNLTWFQFVLKVEEHEVKKVANSIRFLKTSFFELLERTNRQAVSFMRSFFEIEEKVSGCFVFLTFKLKIDLQHFFENALLPLLQFLDLFTCSKESTSQLLIDIQTKLSLNSIFTDNLSIKEAFKSFILEIKANLIRNHIRKVTKVFKFENELSSLLWYLSAPENVDFNCKVDVENILNEERSNIKLGFIGEMISYYLDKYGLVFPFIKSIENIEFALNFNKVFINMRLKIK